MGIETAHDLERIFVRKNWQAPDLRLDPAGNEVSFDYGGEHETLVALHKPRADEVVFSAVISFPVPLKHRADLGCLARGEPPPGSTEPGPLELYDGMLLSPVPHRMLRPDLQSFLASIEHALADPVQRTVRLLRWRLGASGPHVPLHPYAAEWSIDGHEWHGLPTNINGPSWTEQVPRISGEIREQVHALALGGQSEPVAHELFREAWELRVNHRRASLAIGIAALEVGAKQVVLDLVPDGRWLVENQPSPSVMTLILEGIPTIMKERGRPGAVMIDKKKDAVFQEIISGVGLRNQTVHRDSAPPTYEKLVRVLDAVRDFLWLFDAYKGQEWALAHIRPETRAIWLAPHSEASPRGGRAKERPAHGRPVPARADEFVQVVAPSEPIPTVQPGGSGGSQNER